MTNQQQKDLIEKVQCEVVTKVKYLGIYITAKKY